MKPYEIFRRLSSSEVDLLVLAACDDEDIPDKIAGAVITLQRVPLMRLERLNEDVRKSYVRKTLRDKRAEELALFTLSSGLTRAKAGMIESFLAALDLPHEGANLTTDEPVPEPEAALVKKTVKGLAASHGARDVAIFLHAFVEQPDVSWPSLVAMLDSDATLALEDRSQV